MPNRLARETSPYLQQHADNPVDWHPWGEEALRLARERDQPILLSVGYSACHWCHVMAHESFEDPDIAAVMNRNFVNIKVDREERPDIDQIYQTAHQMLTQRAGGWPLTMFLTPDQKPFFGGTYFPRTARYNLPGFGELLERVAQVYREQRQAIAAQNDEMVSLLERSLQVRAAPAADLDAAPIATALQELTGIFDRQHGGLGGAPKFPHPAELELCLREARADRAALEVATVTLEKMARGGICDQLGGGFCRYSVDATWMIPHFEKMLYDNGPLLRLYADAWLVTGNALFRRVCEDTAAWVMREMQAPEGGYYSSLDADSEHVEGKFYVWSHEQVSGLLDEQEYAVASAVFGLDRAPNFEGEHWHLRIARPVAGVAAELGLAETAAQALLDSARIKLFEARERRVRPGRDEKILTSWNALMIQGMAHAAHALDRPDWLQSARQALEFLRVTLWRDGRLLATSKDGRAHLNAYLDDHAFLLAALLELLQADFRKADLELAVAIAETLLARFEDGATGGFFFTSHDHERLILRPKTWYDNATPSGNGVAALALQRLGHLVGDARYLEAAERTLRLFLPQIERHPSGASTLLMALAEHLRPPDVVILRGPRAAAVPWQRALAVRYAPSRLVLFVDPSLTGIPAALDKPLSTAVNAWVCRGVNCLAPLSDVGELLRELEAA
ncbi:MAG TPA: thioredoxin domain-containing protein [Burkholderiales bacterium]|nr:thioredoxin domain-containing protein [Burkholderiales bacterium]